MQTAWPGLALPGLASNMVLTEAYIPWYVSVVLHDPPGIPTMIHLPDTTTGLLLWAVDAQVLFALDAMPALPSGPALGVTVDAETFGLGGVLLPNMLTSYAIPDQDPDSLHTLYLVSTTPYVTVLVQALRQFGAA